MRDEEEPKACARGSEPRAFALGHDLELQYLLSCHLCHIIVDILAAHTGQVDEGSRYSRGLSRQITKNTTARQSSALTS